MTAPAPYFSPNHTPPKRSSNSRGPEPHTQSSFPSYIRRGVCLGKGQKGMKGNGGNLIGLGTFTGYGRLISYYFEALGTGSRFGQRDPKRAWATMECKSKRHEVPTLGTANKTRSPYSPFTKKIFDGYIADISTLYSLFLLCFSHYLLLLNDFTTSQSQSHFRFIKCMGLPFSRGFKCCMFILHLENRLRQ